jgi:septal ring-binding cell division protein DamX
MELTPYLRQLLYNHECVIVPGLGGFLCSYKKFEFNTAAGLLIPARKTVAFNQNLNNNDGLLANHLAQKTNSGFNGALEKINAWVSNLHYTLQQGQTVNLEGIGSLTLNEEKKLVFVPLPDANFLTETYGLGIVKLGKAVATKTAPVYAQPLAATAEKVTAPVADVSPQPKKETTQQTTPLPPVPPQRKKPSLLRRVFVMFIVIVVLSAIFLLQDFAYHAKINKGSLLNMERPHKQPANTDEHEEKTSPSVEMPAESLKKHTDTQPVVERSTAIKSQTDSVFYIIAGAFRNESNAEALIDDLDKKGYNPQIIKIEGSSLYKVGYRQYATRNEAEARLDDVRVKEQNHAAWVLAVKK